MKSMLLIFNEDLADQLPRWPAIATDSKGPRLRIYGTLTPADEILRTVVMSVEDDDIAEGIARKYFAGVVAG